MLNSFLPCRSLKLINITYAFVVLISLQNLLTVKCELNEDEDGHVYKSYQTSVYCKSSYPIQYPKNGKELQSIVKSAIARNLTVKIIGSRHSTTDIICTEGIPVSTSKINYTRLNADNEIVTVGSGILLEDMLNALRDLGRTLITVPSFGGITIGGALGTGAHGSSLLHPTTLSDQVVGLTIIDGLGRLRKISGRNKDLPAFKCHLGLLGALVDVTFKTVPLFKMTIVNYPDSENILLDGVALQEAQIHSFYQIFWFPSSKSVVVSKGNYTPPELTEETPGNAQSNLYPDLTPSEIIATRNTLEEAQSTKNLQFQQSIEGYGKKGFYMEVPSRPSIFSEEQEDGSEQFVNPATGYAYRLISSRCTNRCPSDNGEQSLYIEESAMAFHINDFLNVIQRIKGILAELPATFMVSGISFRFSRSSDGLMAINKGRDSLHIDWFLPMRFDRYNQPKYRIGTHQAMSQALLHELDGRPHWGKNGQYYFTRKILKLRPSEKFRKFQETMKKYDPNGVFLNRFGSRILFQSDKLTVDPNTTRCALMDYCLCSKNEDCANYQVCAQFEDRYPICKNAYNGLVPINPLP